ncbi:hypothetical protein [Blastococcus sp. CT_GayMR16]|uniref:hypothetical protein n=1 Tax=Blastococcus sp. CT_GayMR16 TaxID=2559607 RepID=UPI00107327D1|nr:hypothetical protein [Blastococcus sp. CT_GayMR16]TFV90395.1 hypothetical protein E4P38_02845 [Blastococcus sp. CT_GayMR16]
MKLGNHTIGLRKRIPRVDGDGQPVRTPIGAQVVDVVDAKVRWCLVTPSTARSLDNDEPEDRSAPMTTGMTLLAPPAGVAAVGGLDAADVVMWPITSEETVDGALKLSGPVYQVDGEPGPWAEALQAQLRKSS